MSTVTERNEADPNNTAELRFEDGMTEAMTATASGYFFDGSERGDQDARDFREIIHNFYDQYPDIARMVLAAGLVEVGFEIKKNPDILVETPGEENPEHSLDTRLFMESWHNVAKTVVGMGWRATSKESEFFNQQTVDFVREEIGPGNEN